MRAGAGGLADRAAPPRLALRVLRRLAGPLEAVLLALLDARVARQQAGLAQQRASRLVGLGERARERVRDRAGLAGDPAPGHLGPHAELRPADGPERLGRDVLQRRARQRRVERLAV